MHLEQQVEEHLGHLQQGHPSQIHQVGLQAVVSLLEVDQTAFSYTKPITLFRERARNLFKRTDILIGLLVLR